MATNRAIAVVVCLVAFVVDILSFALPYWSKVAQVNQGLWQYCISGTCFNTVDFDNLKTDWFNGVRAMETLGLLAGIFALIVVILSSFVQSCRGSSVMGILAKIMLLAAAVLILIGVIIYGVKLPDNLHAAFGLAIIAALAYGLAFILLFVFRDSD